MLTLRTMRPLLLMMTLAWCSCLEPQRINLEEQKMNQTTYTFPKDTIECRQGDYVISKTSYDKWKVFLVDDLVLLSRLVPLQFPHGVELIEEKNTLDSAKPARMGDIHLLVTAFAKDFATSDEAAEAVKNKNLGEATPNLCLSITHFPKATSVVRKK